MSAANSMGPERMAWVMEADRLIRSGKNIDAVAAALGKKAETVARNLRYLKNSLPTKAPEPPKETAPDNIIKILRAGTTLDGLGKQLGVSARVAKAHIDDLMEQGYCLDEVDGLYKLSNIPHTAPKTVDAGWTGEQIIRFGLTGDSHINSHYTQLTHLHALYDIFKAEGITDVYHTGDIDDGEQMRPGHHYECYNQGADAHVSEIVRVYPKRDGMTTVFIIGNHDASMIKHVGFDLGQAVANNRPDMRYVGQSQAYINLTPKCVLELRHPLDGSAYALSYKTQKMIEAMSGGEKPAILATGHYHKAEYMFYRNVHSIQTGTTCFTGNTSVSMSDGSKKKICQVKTGDEVITHTGKAQKVLKTFKRFYQGDFHVVYFGRKSNDATRVTATGEHPFLTEINGTKQWVPIKDLGVGDYIFVESTTCKCCGAPIPYYLQMCQSCNPMDMPGIPQKVRIAKGGFHMRRAGSGTGKSHMDKDIIPFCKEMESQGWRIVPVGADVIPDAVGYKDGKLVLFELEQRKGELLKFKQKKYDGAPICNFVDDVRWINCAADKKLQPRSFYESDENGFIKVQIMAHKIRHAGGATRRGTTVYNMEVANDNSYVAGHAVVHNCAQTPWMRGKGIAAHVGGWIIEIRVNDDGTISRFTSTFLPFYRSVADDWKNWR